ncbi:MAG: deoxyribonuclease IV [Candidatus Magasanikbacteria bacterium]|nr:deoxyribonuclease IV [Candidatus Magasanikbacteria bacterium]
MFNAPLNAAALGCEVFQMFSRSPHGGPVAALTPAIIELFQRNMELTGQRECYIHAPYFINFASANPRIKNGSISVIRQELERGTLLGAKYVMAHLGSYKDLGEKAGFKQLVEGLAEMLKGYKGSAQFLIEISAGAGAVIGDTFEEIAEVINNKRLKDYKIGVCFDTQHAFGSGYDLRTPEAVKKTLDKFDKIIGLENLKMFHCNDSKVEFNSHRDRHEHIGLGHIGRNGFEALLADKRLKDKNFILETEHDKVREDLKILKEIRASV